MMLKKIYVILALQQHVNPASHQVTCLASATLAKCGFLCTVLAENPEHHNLAFRVGLFGLEMARPPANTKPLEVRLNGTRNFTLSFVTLMVTFNLTRSNWLIKKANW